MGSGKVLKIVFMGSAPFAVPCLEALVGSRHNVVEVVAQPCKPAGRGMRMTECAVADYAKGKGLALYQPNGVKTAEPIKHLKELGPETDKPILDHEDMLYFLNLAFKEISSVLGAYHYEDYEGLEVFLMLSGEQILISRDDLMLFRKSKLNVMELLARAQTGPVESNP